MTRDALPTQRHDRLEREGMKTRMASARLRFLCGWPWRLAAAFTLAVAAPRAADAAGPEGPPPRLIVGKVHIQPPVSEWTLVDGSTAPEPTIVGGSVTLEVFELLVAEVGVDLIYNSFAGQGNDIFVRAGVAPILADGDYGSSTQGWALQLDALFGYRYLYRYQEQGDVLGGKEKTHGLAGAVGPEMTFWFSRSFGLNLRLLGGVTFPVDQTWTGYWSEPLGPLQTQRGPNIDSFRELRFDYSVDIAFDIGVAF
jgi:hypothetical protein